MGHQSLPGRVRDRRLRALRRQIVDLPARPDIRGSWATVVAHPRPPNSPARRCAPPLKSQRCDVGSPCLTSHPNRTKRECVVLGRCSPRADVLLAPHSPRPEPARPERRRPDLQGRSLWLGVPLTCLLAIGCSEERRVECPAPFVRTVGAFSVESFSPTVVGEAWVRIKLDPLQSKLQDTKVISFTYHPVDAPVRADAGQAAAVGDFGVYGLPLKFDEPGEWRIRFEASWPGGRPFSDGEIFLRVAEAR